MLEKIIKAYDIRGLVKDEVTPDFSFSLGVAFAKFLEIEREPATIVVGEDMRPSSAPLADAFSDGATSQGMDVIRIGLASTDMLYFASGKLNLPGVMFFSLANSNSIFSKAEHKSLRNSSNHLVVKFLIVITMHF